MKAKTTDNERLTSDMARKITASAKPRVNRELYRHVCQLIRAAAQVGHNHTEIAIDYGVAEQDALVKTLTEDGFSVTWNTVCGPRTDDGGIIKISWR